MSRALLATFVPALAFIMGGPPPGLGPAPAARPFVGVPLLLSSDEVKQQGLIVVTQDESVSYGDAEKAGFCGGTFPDKPLQAKLDAGADDMGVCKLADEDAAAIGDVAADMRKFEIGSEGGRNQNRRGYTASGLGLTPMIPNSKARARRLCSSRRESIRGASSRGRARADGALSFPGPRCLAAAPIARA